MARKKNRDGWNILNNINVEILRDAIFGGKNQIEALIRILVKMAIITEDYKYCKKDMPKLYDLLINNFNYENFKKASRETYFEIYPDPIPSAKKLIETIKMGAGDPDWPFAPGQFDTFVKKMRLTPIDEALASDMSIASLEKFSIQRQQNLEKLLPLIRDYWNASDLESLTTKCVERILLEEIQDLVPLFKKNVSGVDFFLKGLPIDQKTSRSVGQKFIDEYKLNIEADAFFPHKHPECVLKSLYENQSSERAGFGSRIIIILPSEKVGNIEDIRKSVKEWVKTNPSPITVSYSFEGHSYTSSGYVIFID